MTGARGKAPVEIQGLFLIIDRHAIMRAFVQMRELVASSRALARKLDELEKKYDSHNKQLIEEYHYTGDGQDNEWNPRFVGSERGLWYQVRLSDILTGKLEELPFLLYQ